MHYLRFLKSINFVRQLPEWGAHWIALAVFSGFSALNNWGAGMFSPDSWAYFELSQTFNRDFYKIEHLRSYWSSEYSAAFPPLWPGLIFVTNKLLNLGPDAAILLNILILFLIAKVADSIAYVMFKIRGPGPLLALASLLHTGFFSEIFSGRSIPIFILFALVVLRIIIINKSNYKVLRFFALGAVLAAMFMTRFDGATWFLILLPFLMILKPGVYGLLAYLSAFAVGISPWVYYSITHFDVILASDNSWVAKSLNPNAFVTDYPAAEGPTILDNLAVAIDIVIGRLPDLLYAIAISPSSFGVIMILALAMILIISKPWLNSSFLALCNKNFKYFFAMGVATVSAVPSNLLTGYYDSRYFALYFLLFVFIQLISIWHNYPQGAKERVLAFVSCVILVTLVLTTSSSRTSSTQLGLTGERELATCLQLGSDHGPILVSNSTQGARLSALYGIRTAFMPANFRRGQTSQETVQRFLKNYEIKYILGPLESAEQWFDGLVFRPFTDCGFNIYRVNLS